MSSVEKETEYRKRILIVDDSPMNREILRGMLEERYDICEAENGQEAMQILEEERESFCLVLLDLHMPVMNGDQLLFLMREQGWLDRLPVIAISAENSPEAIQQMYELGAADYFTRPFDRNVVLCRVENTVELYEKISSNLRDVVDMLSAIFYRILKIDLTEDTYQTIRDGKGNRQKQLREIPSISRRMEEVARRGYIHEEDKESYRRFCKLKNLRARFAGGAHYISHQYRCIVEGEFRWVSMELLRSSEYRQEHQVVMMYVRDINDNHLKNMDAALKYSKDSDGVATLDVTGDLCTGSTGKMKMFQLKEQTRSLKNYVQQLSEKIPEKPKREEFSRIFSRQHLLECFELGQMVVTMECVIYSSEKKQCRLFRTTAEMIWNSFSEKVEATLYFNDVTEVYLEERIPQLIYQKKYENIAVVDLINKKIAISDSASENIADCIRHEYDYLTYVKHVMNTSVPKEEWETFQKSTDLNILQKELQERERYTFSFQRICAEGEKRLKNYTCMYLNKRLGIVVGYSEDITEMSGKDVLTGGFNRQGFITKAEKILKKCPDKTEYTILFFNIKNFKAVNELFGIENGDYILKKTYDMLAHSKLYPLLTARVEADHFACLIRKKDLDYEVLTDMSEKRFFKDGKSMSLSGKCGIFFVEEKPMRVSGMLNRARLAKRYITDEYVKPYMIYNDSMQSAYVDKAKISGELEKGIQDGHLKVYYQPIVDAQTEKIVSAEALIRWEHPQKGFLRPDIFIPALEENGHISELDLHVARHVREFRKNRRAAGKTVVPISVNLSWMDFYDEKIMEWIQKELSKNENQDEGERFEITETSYAAMGEDRYKVLETIRKAGARILLDDFGTGYSSFGMLQNYDFDILKIDMSFVRQIGKNKKTDSILHSIIHMAHSIGLKLVAEGAESKEQVGFLREHRCDYIQGYYFYKPLPETEFEEVLDEMEA